MKRKTVFRIAVVVLVLLAAIVVVPATAIILDKREIESFRALTKAPTIEAEPENCASHYLEAAAAVVAAGTYLEEAAKRLADDEFDWTSIDADIQDFLWQNETVLTILEPTKDMPHCRMPLLYDETGDWGAYGFGTALQLRIVGDVLFWSTLTELRRDNFRSAIETALVNLRLGRDTASAGSYDQATSGIHIFLMASRSLAIALSEHTLDHESLALLKEALPKCDFPQGFDFDTLSNNHTAFYRLASYDSARNIDRIARALHLESLVDIANPAGPVIGYGNTNDSNPLMSYPKPHGAASIDSIEGMSAGLALLRIGVAIQQYVHANRSLPQSFTVLVPDYMDELPENRTGTEFQCNATENRLEIVSPEIKESRVYPKASRRALTFGLEVLKVGFPENPEADGSQ